MDFFFNIVLNHDFLVKGLVLLVGFYLLGKIWNLILFGFQFKTGKLFGLEDYSLKNTSPQPDYLNQLEKETYQKTSVPMMITGTVEGRFLSFLIGLGKCRRVLEIGCFTGYSALSMAESLPEDGKLITIDIDLNVTKIAKKYFALSPHGHKIEHKLGDANQILQELSEEPFDLIFLDADKESYIRYYEIILKKKLLKENGLLVVDNVHFLGGVIVPIVNMFGPFREIKDFNQHVNRDKRVERVQLGIRDGITLIRWKK